MAETWTVGELARLAGVTVRTLHHYDAIGLLRPSTTTEAGYRLYRRAELERLYLVLLYRGAGLKLGAIGRLLDDPGFDRDASFREHRARLVRARDALDGLLANLDRLIEGETMSEHLFEGVPEAWRIEAEQRWGETEAYQESARRTQRYGPEDWARIKAENTEIEQTFVQWMREGVSATDPRVCAVAERARRHICRWYYDCPPAMHAQIAQGYVADPRFRDHYETQAEGLAQYVRDAVVGNAAG